MSNMPTAEEAYILVLGATGAGKSSFINDASNSALEVGHDLRSCTSQIAFSQPFEMEGGRIVLFDTPGFDDTTKTDAEILTGLAVFLSKFHEEQKRLIGVLYIHDISNLRVGGVAVRNIEMFNAVVGEAAARNVVVVTKKWDIVDRTTGETRHDRLATDPQFFKPILDSGAIMMKCSEGNDPLNIVRTLVSKHNDIVLDIQKELVDEGKRLDQTKAGGILYRSTREALREAKAKHTQEIEKLKKQIDDGNAERMRIIIEASRRANEEKIKSLEEKQMILTMNLEQAKKSSIGERALKVFATVAVVAVLATIGVAGGVTVAAGGEAVGAVVGAAGGAAVFKPDLALQVAKMLL